MRKFAILFLVVLTACSAIIPEATVASETTATPEVTKTPAPPSPTATSTPIPSPTSTPQVSYLDILDITQTDSITDVIYREVHIDATIRVDASANRMRTHSIEMPDSRLANIVMRAWWNIIEPDNEGDNAGLAAFAKKWEDVQKGLLPCSELATTFEAFEVGGGPKEEMTIVPACGFSEVPENAISLNIDLIYISLFMVGPNNSAIDNPETPWMDIIFPTGEGAGILVDKANGRLMIFIDSGIMLSGVERKRMNWAISTEVALDWLRKFVIGQKWEPSRSQIQYNRARKWEGEMQVE